MNYANRATALSSTWRCRCASAATEVSEGSVGGQPAGISARSCGAGAGMGRASVPSTWRTVGWMVGMVAGSEVDVRLKAQRRESRTSRGEGKSEGCRRAGISRAPHRPTGGRTVRFSTGSASSIPPPSVLQEPGPAPGCGRRWSVACIAPLHVVADRGTPKRRPAMSGRQSARAATVSERPVSGRRFRSPEFP